MTEGQVVCPHCGKVIEGEGRSTCYECHKVMFRFQDSAVHFFEKNIGKILLAVLIFQIVAASVLAKKPYIPIETGGFTTDGAGLIGSFLLFYCFTWVYRYVELALRRLIPGKPYWWKLSLLSVLSIGVYAALAYGLGYYLFTVVVHRGVTGDSVSSTVVYQSGRAYISAGNGANYLAIPGILVFCIMGILLELAKIFRWIYPEPGLPEDLLNL